MRLLLRLSLFVLLAGLLTGLVLRRSLAATRLGVLLAAASLPCLLHLVYVLTRVPFAQAGFAVRAAVFVLLGVVAAVAAFLLSLRLASGRPSAAALYPVLLGAFYGLVPLLWFFYMLRGAGVLLDSVAHIWLTGALLFEAAALWGILAGRGGPGEGAWALPRPFRRR